MVGTPQKIVTFAAGLLLVLWLAQTLALKLFLQPNYRHSHACGHAVDVE